MDPARASCGRKVTIVIPYYEHVSYLESCLRSIGNTEAAEYDTRLLLVDNGSTENFDTALLADLGLSYTLVRNEFNRGVSHAWNLGLRLAMEEHGAEAVCLLNSDVVLGPGWISHCLEALDRGSFCAVPFNYTFEGSQPEDFHVRSRLACSGDLTAAYRNIRLKRHHQQGRRYLEEGSWDVEVEPVEMHEAVGFSGFCFWLSRLCIQEIGYMDEGMSILYSDTDYRNRLLATGHPPACVHTCMAHHFGSITFGPMRKSRAHQATLQHDRHHFERKWLATHERIWSPQCTGKMVKRRVRNGH